MRRDNFIFVEEICCKLLRKEKTTAVRRLELCVAICCAVCFGFVERLWIVVRMMGGLLLADAVDGAKAID